VRTVLRDAAAETLRERRRAASVYDDVRLREAAACYARLAGCVELAEMAQVIVAQPAWEGRPLAQELFERRAAERRERKRIPEWFSVQDLVPAPWERELVDTA
jgi:hypothetical protein